MNKALDPVPALFGALIEALPDSVVITTPAGVIVAVNEQLCSLSGFRREGLVGSQIEMLVPTRFRAEHVAERAAYITDDGGMRSMSARPDIVLVRADKRELPVDIALSTTGDGPDRLAVASVRDASVRREAEVAREREYRFLAAMNDITAAVFTGREVDETLRAIAQRSRKLVDADLAMVTVPHADGDQLHVIVADGHGSAKLEGSLVSSEASLAGIVMREREPVMITDAASDPRIHHPVDWPEDLGPALFVPLHARDETLGSLTIANRQGRAMFRSADVTLMRAFAAHATLAILDAHAQQQLERVALLEDRERVAAALHDSVINRISSASLTLHTTLGTPLPESVCQRLGDAVEDLDAAISSIRDAVFPR